MSKQQHPRPRLWTLADTLATVVLAFATIYLMLTGG